ncbi:histidine phosphatase family protein [Paenibacillus arenilitoris]|uniref:Histidine phosphatase family protein n=1 Tax=Paenibacillus arenilitoris TaxID=2772299 RepID=A0A927H581_9BACL|nr:histidine phosphatase family protein [Paenibacillus arenilitoris]MBD2868263.1 histidine phosphatase family protein [Paenibacillus arenilitoris]
MKKIYLIRHCKAEGQEPEAALTKEGEEQAERLADLLSETEEPIELVVTSPYARAIASIKPYCARRHLGWSVDERLKERVLSTADLPDWMERLKHTYEDMDAVYEGGESSREAMARGTAVVEEIMAGPQSCAAVVTHGALMSLIIRSVDPAFGFEEWSTLSNPDVYALSVQDGRREIKRVWK